MAFRLLGRLAAAGSCATALVFWAWRSRNSEDAPGNHQSWRLLPQSTLATSYCKEPPSSSSPGSIIAGAVSNLGPGRGKGGVSPRGIPREEGAGLEGAVERCREMVRRVMVKEGVPGAVMAVAKDGRIVWSEGMGLADVENNIPCTSQSG